MSDRLQTLQDAELALRPFVPLAAQLTGKDLTLERVEPLMELLGNPQRTLKIVHIAGTSGKTSTSYYIAALLSAGGQKVGLTVSPHVDKISERVQIGGAPISDEKFCSELELFLGIIAELSQPPSYFELLFAFALWVFGREGVDYAVVETGLGGLHDSSNVATEPNKLCVITDIGFDHMHVLGNTLREIATQKIGITHPGNVCITYRQSDEVMRAFDKWVINHDVELVITDESTERQAYSEDLSQLPLYQQRNWLLARRAYHYLLRRDGLPGLTSEAERTTQQLQVPGRMEVIERGGKVVVMDGAHNEQKMAAFVSSFRARFPEVRPAIMVALKVGKEHQAVSPLLADLASQIIVTTFNTSQDLPVRSIDPDVVAQSLRAAGAADVQVVPDQRLACELLLQTPAPVCIITGSFYLLSQLRHEGCL